jgi:hypothetical protein
MDLTSWSGVIQGLDVVLQFGQALGLDDAMAKSRFTAFRTRIVELDALQKQEGDSATVTAFMRDAEVNTVALAESVELASVLPYLESLPLDLAKRKLKIVLQGPERPQDENANSNEARNTMFELNIGARLHRAGMSVDISHDTDLEFTCGGVRWFGECKRPYEIKNISSNLSAACAQLDKRLRASRLAARGLIAISISRPLAGRARYLEYSGEPELRRSLKEHGSAAVRLMKSELERHEKCRSVGSLGMLVGHLMMPAWDTTVSVPTMVQHSAGANLCRDEKHDGEALWRAIEQTFNG